MVVIGSTILPHGCLVFDGNENSNIKECIDRYNNMDDQRLKEGARKLYTACENVVSDVLTLKPELIILHTPHSIHVEETVGVMLNEVAAGSAEWNENWKDFHISLNMDSENSTNLVKEFREKNIPAKGITNFTRTFPAPLRWGQVVPLWFIENKIKNLKYIIVSQYLPPKGIARELDKYVVHKDMGNVLYNFAEHLSERVLFVISGDLAHKHQTDCTQEVYLPDPTSTVLRTPDEEHASKFDDLIGKWVTQGNNEMLKDYSWESSCVKYLHEATEIHPKALSCGLGGFYVLHGFLEELSKSKKCKSKLYENCFPTYFGMLVALFTFEEMQ